MNDSLQSARKKALLAGASGLIGSELCKLLVASPFYEQVTVLARRPLGEEIMRERGTEKLRMVTLDFDDLHRYKEEFQVDDVFCCLGTTMKKAKSKALFEHIDLHYPVELASMAKSGGASMFAVVSAMGADPGSILFYNRVKGCLERKLSGMGLRKLIIVRPSLLLGRRKELRIGERVAAVLAKPLAALLVGPLRKYRPIAATQVAAAMFALAQTDNDAAIAVYSSDQLAALVQ